MSVMSTILLFTYCPIIGIHHTRNLRPLKANIQHLSTMTLIIFIDLLKTLAKVPQTKEMQHDYQLTKETRRGIERVPLLSTRRQL